NEYPMKPLIQHSGTPATRGIRLFQSQIANCKSQMHRPGFSFTEVLFAVMILGIGFIMVAAIFPVAIQQTSNSSQESNAATMGKGGVNTLEKIAVDSIMPPTFLRAPTRAFPGQRVIPGDVWSFRDDR